MPLFFPFSASISSLFVSIEMDMSQPVSQQPGRPGRSASILESNIKLKTASLQAIPSRTHG